MNQANVDALAAVLWKIQYTGSPDWASEEGESLRDLAARLAAEGVLVPSALTEVEMEQVHNESTERWEGFLLSNMFRAALERIAKGVA